MRIVTWNINNAGSAKNRVARVWEYLLGTLKPDIALLQEARKPQSGLIRRHAEDHQSHWEESATGWGTAVVSFGFEMQRITRISYNDIPGRCVACEVKIPGSSSLTVASLHAPTKPSVFPNLDLCIAQLENHSNGERLIFGGDLNTARVAEHSWPGYSHGDFWNSVDERRLFDCHYNLVGREKNTLVRKRIELRIQNDHIFTSNDLKPFVRSAEIMDENSFIELDLSDHLPVVVDLDIE